MQAGAPQSLLITCGFVQMQVSRSGVGLKILHFNKVPVDTNTANSRPHFARSKGRETKMMLHMKESGKKAKQWEKWMKGVKR